MASIVDYDASPAAQVAILGSQTGNSVVLKKTDPFFDYHPTTLQRLSYAYSYMTYQYEVWKLREQTKQYDQSLWHSYEPCLKFRFPECTDMIQHGNISDRTVAILNKLNIVCIENKCTLIVINIDSDPLAHFFPSNPSFAYYDLSGALREEMKKHPLTFVYDQHYNEQTNQFIGEKLTGIFKSLGL